MLGEDFVGRILIGEISISKCFMYGILTYIYHKFKLKVGNYSIHGLYEIYELCGVAG